MRETLPLVVWAYARALRILPREVLREDGSAMVDTFADLWAGADSVRSRWAHAARAFGKLPGVAVAEWLDVLGITAGNGPDTTAGDGKGVGMGWVGSLGFAARSLRKSPGFTLIAMVLVGLGVGAVTTIFTLVDHVLLRELPYPDAERLVRMGRSGQTGLILDELRQTQSMDLFAAVEDGDANLVGEGNPVRLTQAKVSEDFFRMFGARPVLGRLLVQDDFQAADNVVLSYGLWERVSGADAGVLGRSLRVDDDVVTVVGVLSRDFRPPEAMLSGGVDLWRPIDWSRVNYSDAGWRMLRVAGRMTPGATLEAAAAEIAQIHQRLSERYPEDYVGPRGDPVTSPPIPLRDVTSSRARPGLSLLLGAVALLLAVACTNVAHLFLARGLGRSREIAVRRALGAPTRALVRQLLAESLLTGVAGGLLGVGLAVVGVRIFLTLNPTALPGSTHVSVDARVLLFAAGVSLLTALAFGLLPALRAVGGDLTLDLGGSNRSATTGRRGTRIRSGLVVAEVAMSLVLMTQAGLLLRSFLNAQSVDPGFTTEGVWTLPLTPNQATQEEYVEAMEGIRASLASLPEVRSATYGLTQPFQFAGMRRCCWAARNLRVDGVEVQGDPMFMVQPVGPDHFQTLGIPMVAGAAWSRSESVQEPWPAVISETVALKAFGSADRAVGQSLDVAMGRAYLPVRITGVSGDTRYYGLDQEVPDVVLTPIEVLPFVIPQAHFAVRVRNESPPGLAASLREAVWAASPAMPVPTVRSMSAWIEASNAGRRFDSALFGTFAILALLLASAGLYGTLLYSVGEQRRELGIRLALGAGRGHVQRRVVARGLALAAVGAALGLAGSRGLGRFLESRLYGMEPGDPTTLTCAVLLLLAAAALASWLPALRAGRTDPVQTLNAE